MSSLVSTAVRPGAVVRYDYVLSDAAGVEIERSDPRKPFGYLHGRQQIISGLEKALEGKGLGTYDFVIPAADAYGQRNSALVVSVPLTSFPAPAQVGLAVVVRINEGPNRLARIVAVGETEATVDANHALADKELHFHIAIRQIRDADPTELESGTVSSFPFDVLGETKAFPGKLGDRLRAVRSLSMFPPFPWGTYLYGTLMQERCAKLEGDVVELGVGLGGMSIFLGHLAADLGKSVYSLDSFEGLPQPHPANDNDYFLATDYAGETDVLERFRRSVQSFGLEQTITPVKGFFEQTVPQLADRRFCFAHLDSDLFGSIKTSLEGVYDKVVDGGVIVIDDFFHPAQGPARAASAFFNERGIRPVYHVSFPYSVVVIKGEQSHATRSLDGNVYSLEMLRSDERLEEAVQRSVRLACPGTSAMEGCEELASLLAGTGYDSADIYRYWHALRDFWDSIGAYSSSRGPIRI